MSACGNRTIHTNSQRYGSRIPGMQTHTPASGWFSTISDDLAPKRAPLLATPHSHLSPNADANPYKHLHM